MSRPLLLSGEAGPLVGGPTREKLTPGLLFAFTLAVMLVRLVLARLIHLTEDEAYYRLWAEHPALGYYDHPPMVAWWIAIGRTLVGDNALGVRLLPILANALSVMLVYDITRMLGGSERMAVRAGLWLNATLLLGMGAILAIPDAPAGFFWTLAVWAALNARNHAPLRWWAIAGLAAGLATLSKYSALFLAPGMVLWLATSKEGRAALLRPGPWIAAAIAVALFSLNVAWNAEHHWVTFARQFGRVAPGRFAPRYLIELLAGQVFLLNPLIAAFAFQAFNRRRRWMTLADPLALLAIAAPFAAYLALHSLHDRVQAHWPAPLYPAVVVLAAMLAEEARPGSTLGRLRTAVPIMGYAVGALVMLHLALPGTDLQANYEPALALRRWPDFAARVEQVRLAAGARWVGAVSYGTQAQLAAEPALTAPVTEIAERARYAYEPPGATPDIAAPGLVLDLERRLSAEDLRRCFTDVRSLPDMDRGSTKGPDELYRVFRVAGARRRVAGGCWMGEDLSR